MHRRAMLAGLGLSALPWRASAQGADARAQFEAMAVEIAFGEGQAPLRLSLKELMDVYAVPGLSVAVIDNYDILWAKGYGLTEGGATTAVGAGTLFQAASISKTAAAVGAMTLVAEGRLSLDTDINTVLKSWRLPDSDFTKTQKVTLRRLMSHTAGLGVHGFDGYEAGAPLPTVPQILDGLAPANSPAVRSIVEPGTQEIYSGGGVTIEQLLMTEAAGRAFPDILAERVLGPFGMASSAYAQPLPAALAARASSANDVNGTALPGRWHVYPEMAAAGLWTTPSDLSRFLIGVANARRGVTAPISQDVATQMLTTQIKDGGFGLGFGMMGVWEGLFGHSGSNAGFRSFMQMNWQTGKGAVLMINGEGGDAILGPIMERLRVLFGLFGPDYKAHPSLMVVAVLQLRGVDEALAAFDYQRALDPQSVGPMELNRAGYNLMGAGYLDDAIRLFQHNAETFPQDGNVFDSLAEAYMNAGKNDLAIENYKKSLERDPGNDNARAMLKKLGAG